MYVPVYTLLIDDEDDYRISKEFSCSCSVCTENCPCRTRFGPAASPYEQPIIECGSHCQCLYCDNKKILSGKIPKLSIKPTKTKGLGVFAEEHINKGEYIGEYAGKVVDDDAEGEFVFQVKENTPTRVIVTTIDAGFFGNLTRFLNHSCDPNVVAVPIRVNFIVPNIGFFALKEIKQGEELCFLYRDEPFGKPCFCGEAKCKGVF